MNLNQLAAEIHKDNAHWWHHPVTGERLNRNKAELLLLTLSEVTEAMEGERKNLMDDHLPKRKMAEVELADVQIRLFDYAGAYSLDLDASQGAAYLPPMPDNKSAALMQMCIELTHAAEVCGGFPHWVAWRLRRVLGLIDRYAVAHGYDVAAARTEKRAYNAVRADHKAEDRLAPGGKQF